MGEKFTPKVSENKMSVWGKEQWMSAASFHDTYFLFREAPQEILNDYEVMKTFVLTQHQKTFGKHIDEIVPPELLDNQYFILSCMATNSDTVQYASDRLKDDKAFTLLAMNGVINKYEDEIPVFSSEVTPVEDLSFLNFMGDTVIGDREVMLHALEKGSWLNSIHNQFFYYCGEALRGNPEFVLEAATKIVETSKRINFDDEDNRKAEYEKFRHYGSSNEKCYSRISEELLNDKEFCIKLVSADPIAYGVLKEEFQQDIEVATAAYEADNNVVPLLKGEIFQNKDFAIKAVHVNPHVFSELPSDMRADKEIMLSALTSTLEFRFDRYQSIEPELLCDREVMLQATKSFQGNSKYASHKLRDDPEFVLETKCFASMSDRLKREVGNQDVEQCLTSIVNKNKLERELSNKPSKAENLLSTINHDADIFIKRTSSSRMKI
ncbi:DUF4116 domain-containing protein [Burkholderia contaminans]|uniref:DUF4116 domain-containing protein n=1 Tax=Burkholderia contaminans TaxID=488447 RepID=UPI00158ECEF7|nr:DUF4116 domain-containing protein [Burkholderia contaminans]